MSGHEQHDEHEDHTTTAAPIAGLPLSAWSRIFAFYYDGVNADARTDHGLRGAHMPLLISHGLLGTARRALYTSPTVFYDRIDRFHYACISHSWEYTEPGPLPASPTGNQLSHFQRVHSLRRSGPDLGTNVRNLTIFASPSDDPDPSVRTARMRGRQGAVHPMLLALLSRRRLSNLTLVVSFSTGRDARLLLMALRLVSVTDRARIELRMMPEWDEKLVRAQDVNKRDAEAEAAREAKERAFHQSRKVVADMLRSYAAAVSGRLGEGPPVRPARTNRVARAFAAEALATGIWPASNAEWERKCLADERAQRQIPLLSLVHVFELNWRVLERHLDSTDLVHAAQQIVGIENAASWPRYGPNSDSPPATRDASEQLVQKLWHDIYPYAEDDPLALTDWEYDSLLQTLAGTRMPSRADDDSDIEEQISAENRRRPCGCCQRGKSSELQCRLELPCPHASDREQFLRRRVVEGSRGKLNWETHTPSNAELLEAVHTFFYSEMLHLQDGVRHKAKSSKNATTDVRSGQQRIPDAAANAIGPHHNTRPYTMVQLDTQQMNGVLRPFTVAVAEGHSSSWKEAGFHRFIPSAFATYSNVDLEELASSTSPTAAEPLSAPTHADIRQTLRDMGEEELLPPISFPTFRILAPGGGQSTAPLAPLAWLANIVPVLPASKSLPIFNDDSGPELAILLGAKLGQVLSKWNTKSFSFIAEDPIAARVFSGDLWPQLQAEYIRVKLPVTLHPLDVFKSYSDTDNDTKRLLNPATRTFEFEVQDVNKFDDRWLDPRIPMEVYRIPTGRDSWETLSPMDDYSEFATSVRKSVADGDAAPLIPLSPIASAHSSTPSSPAFSFTSDASYVDVDSDELELNDGEGETYDAAAAAAQLKRIEEREKGGACE